MDYILNSTKAYHTSQLSTLGWELTVCNALYPEGTLLRHLLRRNDSYGGLLHEFLGRLMPMDGLERIIEVGGGYGYLMKTFLDRNGGLKPHMLDISPFLLEKQKETLRTYEVSFSEEDFLEMAKATLGRFEMAILNENVGDFPALVGVDSSVLESQSECIDENLNKMKGYFSKYGFEPPKGATFNVNTGAIEAVEKLCAAGVPYIFISEHSCEATAPVAAWPFVDIEPSGDPERISLMGHDEYSIKFSYLQRVAAAFGYACLRGPLADFIILDRAKVVEMRSFSGADWRGKREIIDQFVEDLYKYEYLIMIKGRV